MKYRVIIVLILFFLIIATILYFFINKKDKNIIETYGNIEIRTVDLSFQVSGIIKDLYVEEGDYVKKGDLIAVLDDRDYKVKYKKALYLEKSSLAQKNEDISKYLRNNPLCKDNTISKQECTTLLNKKDMAIAQYQENVANREYQKNQLDYAKMYAPQNGIITTRAQEIGARVETNQTVFVLSLNEPIWVRTYIQENDLGNVKYGTKATILTDSIDLNTGKKKEYPAHVGYISPIAEFTPKTVQTQDLRADLVYRIRVYVDEVDEYLRQGMPVTVKLKIKDE